MQQVNDLPPPVTNKDGSAKVSSLIKWGCNNAQEYYSLKAKYEALQKVSK